MNFELTLTQLSFTEVLTIKTKQKIDAACMMAGITVTELGARMGYSQSGISMKLRNCKFSLEDYENMAEILGCEYHSYFEFPNGNKVE